MNAATVHPEATQPSWSTLLLRLSDEIEIACSEGQHNDRWDHTADKITALRDVIGELAWVERHSDPGTHLLDSLQDKTIQRLNAATSTPGHIDGLRTVLEHITAVRGR